MDTVLEDVPKYHPDALLVELSERSLYRLWDRHLDLIALRHNDLKYDFVRRIFQEAGIAKNDSMTDVHTKLAPFRLQVIAWTLQMIRAKADSLHIPAVIVIFPALEPGDLSPRRVHTAASAYGAAGMPILDLTDTFEHIPDTQPYLATHNDPSNLDVHPNRSGNALMLDDLYRKLAEQPAVWTEITGLDPSYLPHGR